MNKKILASVTAIALILQSFAAIMMISVNAEQKATEKTVAVPISEKENPGDQEIFGTEKLSDFAVRFDYTPSDKSEALLSYDFDSSLKKTLYSENFENYTGALPTAALAGHGTALSCGAWQTVNVFETDGDIDVTAFLNVKNFDWGGMQFYLKNDLYLELGGNRKANPRKLRLINRGEAVGEYDLLAHESEGVPQVFENGCYFRAVINGGDISVFLSKDTDITDSECLIRVTLPENGYTARNTVGFRQDGNTGFYIDDITVKSLTESGYDTVRTETKIYKRTYFEDFENCENPPSGGVITDGHGGKWFDMLNDWQYSTSTFGNTNGNYIADFFLKTGNPDWDLIDITVRDNLKLSFRGKNNSGTGKYTALLNSGENSVAKTTEFATPINGTCIRIEYKDGLVNIYSDASGDFSAAAPILTAKVDGLGNMGKLTVSKNNVMLNIDDIAIYDFDDYTLEVDEKSTGNYGLVRINGDELSVNGVNGKTVSAVKTEKLSLKNGKTYNVAIMRERGKMTAMIDGKGVLTADIPFDENNRFGELLLENKESSVKNVKIYDSGRIKFDGSDAVLIPLEIADNITALAVSDKENSLKYSDGEISVSVNDNNGTVCTSGWLKEDAADFSVEFTAKAGRPDWINDRFYFTVPGDIKSDGNSYQWSPDELYKKGYAVNFGVNEKGNAYSGLSVVNGSSVSISSFANGRIPHWANTDARVRIVRKADKIRVYIITDNGAPVLIEQATDASHISGNIYWYHRQGGASVSDIKAYDTENYKIVKTYDNDYYKTAYSSYIANAEDALYYITPGERYTAENIYVIKQYIEQAAKKSPTKENYEELKEVFEAFLNHGTPKLSFSLVSDVQNGDLSGALENAGQALVGCGDMTAFGTNPEWISLAEKLKSRQDLTYAIGLGTGELNALYSADYETVSADYLKELSGILPQNADKPYYSLDIGGYHFAVLGSEQKNGEIYSLAQLDWLESELSAAPKDKPLFVVSHAAIYDTALGAETYKRLCGILEKYKNRVFCLSGALENNFDDDVQVNKTVNFINLDVPTYGVGYGYTVEVYGDSVVFRAKNFAENISLPQYDIIYNRTSDGYKLAEKVTVKKPTQLVAKYEFNNGDKSPITLSDVGDMKGKKSATATVKNGGLVIENTQGHGYFSSAFAGNKKLSELNWSFDYKMTGDCWWMTQEFYMLANKGKTDNCYVLRIKGAGHISDNQTANVFLIRNTNGESTVLAKASCASMLNGDTYRFNIVISEDKITCTFRPVGLDIDEAVVLSGDINPSQRYKGNIYMYGWDPQNLTLDNMEIYDGMNISAFKAPEISEPTKLIEYYNTQKTVKQIEVKNPAEGTADGPWYRFKNPHANAMYLSESLTGDRPVRNVDMSFTYYASGYWMTNEFYIASSDRYGNSAITLRFRGSGTAVNNNRAELLVKYRGVGYLIDSAEEIPALSDEGAYNVHINVNNGKVRVEILGKNQSADKTVVLQGDIGEKIMMGGVYMYAYDDCEIRLRDIVIYDGADISKAAKPDKSTSKKTLVNADFSDGKSPVEFYDNEETGVKLDIDDETGKLHFNTNHNNYMQIGGFTDDEWLEDFTAEFNYLGHRGDWNITRIGWHPTRKSGDLYNGIWLAVLGNEVAANEDNPFNYAKEKGANIQLISSSFGQQKTLATASIPEINEKREYRFRITVEGAKITVWAWIANEDMPAKPLFTATEENPVLCYGDIWVHAWCSDFSLDNIKILNWADYSIPKATSNLSKPIGEIMRVDRIYEKTDMKNDKPNTDVKPVPKKGFPWAMVIIPIAAVLTSGVIILIIAKRRKKDK